VILLETKRLIVKPTSLDNLDNTYKLYSDPEVMRYVGRGAKTYEETCNAVKLLIAHHEKHGFSTGDVYEKETGLYVGRAGLVYLEMRDDQPDIEIGYILHKIFWNKGYGTELAKGTVEWGFNHLPVNKLIANVSPKNISSCHVLEKIGMSYVGNFPYQGKLHFSDYEEARYEITLSKFKEYYTQN
jgi:[ribosomal protein S5]-alanine N-acetyltransferase